MAITREVEHLFRRVKDRREFLGIDKTRLSNYLAEEWGYSHVSSYTEEKFESSSYLVKSINRKSNSVSEDQPKDDYPQIFSDYLSALGFSEKEKKKLFRDLNAFVQRKSKNEFHYVDSNVKQFDNSSRYEPVSSLDLSVRARKSIRRKGLETLGELERTTAHDLLNLRNFGLESLTKVRNELQRFGIYLRGDEPAPHEKPNEKTSPSGVNLENKLDLDTCYTLNLSVRATNVLETEGINTLRDLLPNSSDDLMRMRNFGHESLTEVRTKLGEIGLSLYGEAVYMGNEEELGNLEHEKILDGPVSSLGLTVRSRKGMVRKGIMTIRELIKTPPSELRGVLNMGAKSIADVRKKLSAIGIDWDAIHVIKEREGYEDPLGFFQKLFSDNQIADSNQALLVPEVDHAQNYHDGGDFWTGLYARNDGMHKHVISIHLTARDDRKIRSSVMNFLSGEKTLYGRNFGDFNPALHTLERIFGTYKTSIDTHFEYYRKERGHNTDENITLCVEPVNKGYALKEMRWTGLIDDKYDTELKEKNQKKMDWRSLGPFTAEGDFRPVLHRLLEVWAGIPRFSWHDPAMYSSATNNEELETLVNDTVGLLFKGDEQKGILDKIERAQLKMRRNWASVPRLSLGAIKMPTPGQKDISKDKFVTEAAPYLVEYLSSLGIMESDEAEDLISRKLVNHFLHNSSFQLDREKARRIVSQLKERDAAEKTA